MSHGCRDQSISELPNNVASCVTPAQPHVTPVQPYVTASCILTNSSFKRNGPFSPGQNTCRVPSCRCCIVDGANDITRCLCRLPILGLIGTGEQMFIKQICDFCSLMDTIKRWVIRYKLTHGQTAPPTTATGNNSDSIATVGCDYWPSLKNTLVVVTVTTITHHWLAEDKHQQQCLQCLHP